MGAQQSDFSFGGDIAEHLIDKTRALLVLRQRQLNVALRSPGHFFAVAVSGDLTVLRFDIGQQRIKPQQQPRVDGSTFANRAVAVTL